MLLSLLACAEPRPPADRGPLPDTWHARVRPLVETRCAACHAEGGGAPFAIDTAAAAAAAVWAAHEGLMPPARFDPACRSTVDQRWLTEDDLTLLDAWEAAGFPEGDPADYAPPAPPARAPEPAGEPTYVVDIGEDHVPEPGFDDAVAFFPEFAFPSDAFVTAVRVVPDQPGLVHHATVFAVDDDGNPLMGDEHAESPINALVAWAPGAPPWVLPDGAALVVPSGARLRIEVHYSTVGWPDGEPVPADRTRVEVWTMPGPPTSYAYLVPFVLTAFEVPAGDPAFTLTDEVTYSGLDAEVVAVTPHMHLLGRAARMERATGECVLDTPNYRFEQQALHWLAAEDRFAVVPGDAFRMSCTWDNTGGGPVPEGPGTHDEMCQVGWLVTRPYGE